MTSSTDPNATPAGDEGRDATGVDDGRRRPVEVRDAGDDDVGRICQIFNQAIPGGDAEWTERFHTVDDRLEWLQRRRASNRPVLVAVSPGPERRVVGVASYSDFRDSTCREGFVHVVEHSVYLDDAAKGSGAADALMDELEARARADGIRVMIATVDGRNEVSLRFHERRGFREVGRLPAVGYTFGVWRDFVILQLDLSPAVDGHPPRPA